MLGWGGGVERGARRRVAPPRYALLAATSAPTSAAPPASGAPIQRCSAPSPSASFFPQCPRPHLSHHHSLPVAGPSRPGRATTAAGGPTLADQLGSAAYASLRISFCSSLSAFTLPDRPNCKHKRREGEWEGGEGDVGGSPGGTGEGGISALCLCALKQCSCPAAYQIDCPDR